MDRLTQDKATLGRNNIKEGKGHLSRTGHDTRFYSVMGNDRVMNFAVVRRDRFGEARFARMYPHSEDGETRAKGDFDDQCKF